MSLTGPVFLSLVVGLTVLAFAALVACWPRLAGRSLRRVLARAGLLLGVNVMVLLAALGLMNAKYGFYGDWSDLTGTYSHGYAATSRLVGAGARQAASTSLGPGEGESAAPSGSVSAPLAAGPGLHRYRVRGLASGVDAEVYVSLPAGYDWRSAHRYPVLETFPGYPGLPTQWDRTLALPQVLAVAATSDRIRPAVVVSATTEVPAGVDTECANGRPGEPQLETWLTQDVPDWVGQHFDVDPDRTGWATIGMSAGGWCAAMAALLHPQRYAAAVVMGGYFQAEFEHYVPFTPDSAPGRRYDLVRLAQQAPPPVAVWMETSPLDHVSYRSSTALLHAARAPTSLTAIVLADAGHRTGIWQQLLPTALAWLGAQVPGFGPAGRARRT